MSDAPSINFAGLASGLNSEAIVNKLVEVERAPIAQFNKQKSDFQTHIIILNDLVGKLGALSTVGAGVDTANEIHALKATSSSDTTASITVSGAAKPGDYTVNVLQLARTEHNLSQSFATDQIGVEGTAGSLQIQVGLGDPVTLDYDEGESLTSLADRINNSGARAVASVIFDGTSYYLAVNGRDTGAANTVAFSQISGTPFTFAQTQAAQDSQIQLEGLTVSRPTNALQDVFPGATVALKQVGTGIKLAVERDPAGEKTNVKKLITAYNIVVSALQDQLKYSGTTKGTNTLFGDSTLRELQGSMSGVLGQLYNGVVGGDLGFKVATTGNLELDEFKYDAAAQADSEKIATFLTGDSGFVATLAKMVKDYTTTGSDTATPGILVSRKSGIVESIKTLDENIAKVETRAEDLGNRMRKVFSNLEVTISELKSQGDRLNAALGK